MTAVDSGFQMNFSVCGGLPDACRSSDGLVGRCLTPGSAAGCETWTGGSACMGQGQFRTYKMFCMSCCKLYCFRSSFTIVACRCVAATNGDYGVVTTTSNGDTCVTCVPALQRSTEFTIICDATQVPNLVSAKHFPQVCNSRFSVAILF